MYEGSVSKKYKPVKYGKEFWGPDDVRRGVWVDPWENTLCTLWEYGTDDQIMEYLMGMSFKKLFGGTVRRDMETALDDADFLKRWPVLNMLLVNLKDDDGKLRLPCTLTIVCEHGMAKAGLRERNEGLNLWVSSGTIMGVFDALEEAVQADPPQWRRMPEKALQGKK